jgi:hypothetical protein
MASKVIPLEKAAPAEVKSSLSKVAPLQIDPAGRDERTGGGAVGGVPAGGASGVLGNSNVGAGAVVGPRAGDANPGSTSARTDDSDKVSSGLAYSIAIVLNVIDPDHKPTDPNKQPSTHWYFDEHRRLVRALLAAGLKVGILESLPETADKIVLLVDAYGVALEEEKAIQDSVRRHAERLKQERENGPGAEGLTPQLLSSPVSVPAPRRVSGASPRSGNSILVAGKGSAPGSPAAAAAAAVAASALGGAGPSSAGPATGPGSPAGGAVAVSGGAGTTAAERWRAASMATVRANSNANVMLRLRKRVMPYNMLLAREEDDVKADLLMGGAATALAAANKFSEAGRRNRTRAKSSASDVQHDEPTKEAGLSPAEELVLTHRIILRSLNEINVDDEGVLCEFDILTGGARNTPLERVVVDIFPLHDVSWNVQFMERLRFKEEDTPLWWPEDLPGSPGKRDAVPPSKWSVRLAHAKTWWAHFRVYWVRQDPSQMGVEDLRHRIGDRISVYLYFMLAYRYWVLLVTVLATSNYVFVRFSHWNTYLVTSAAIGLLVSAFWGPSFARSWTAEFFRLTRSWNARHVLLPARLAENPNVSREFIEMSPEDRAHRRWNVRLATVGVVTVNILLLAPVSLFFTQWYVYGKFSPTCDCCRFFVSSGIGNGSRAMESVPRFEWDQGNCSYADYMVDNYAPLDLRVGVSECTAWSTCFAMEASTVGTDRWVYILIQGIAMGLLLDVVQTNIFRKLTKWLTNLEGHMYLETFDKFLVRKQFFFVWTNMFFWYLTITFVYVPYGADIQDWLVRIGWSVIVPPWGFRPHKINLDEAFVTPMVVTALLNFLIDTFIPSLLARIKMKLLIRTRHLSENLAVPKVAHVAVAHRRLRVRLGRRDSDDASLADSEEAGAEDAQVKALAKKARVLRMSFAACKKEGMTGPLALFKQVEQSLTDIEAAAEDLHFYSHTPDENSYSSMDVLSQMALPVYDENEEYLVLVLQLGYLSMFTPAWGLLPFAATVRLGFSYRGSAYKLLFGCKRRFPMGSLDNPGEWLTTVYATFLLAIPVICAEFSLATGGIEAFMHLTGHEHVCSNDMLEREVMDPKFDCFPAASKSFRGFVTFLMEHICFFIFAAVFFLRDPSSATPAQQWAARRGQRGGHGAPGSPASAAQRRFATSSPVLSSTPASAQTLDPALREQALHQQVDALKSFAQALTERQLYDVLARFMEHDRDSRGWLKYADAKEHVKESVQRYCVKQLDRKMCDRDFEDIWVAVLRSMQTRGEKFSEDSLAVDAFMLVKAYDHAALNPLLAIYFSEAPLMVQHGDKAQQQQVRSQEHKDGDAEDGYGYGDAADKGKAANNKRAAEGGSK